MLSNQKIKWIQSLSRKKFRQLHNAYVIEGTKIVQTALLVCPEKIIHIYLEEEFQTLFEVLKEKICITEPNRLKKISNHSNPSNVVAVMSMPSSNELSFSDHKIKVFLDGVQDPGNVGTIIRTCDWYGVKDLILNNKCADLYSPKVIQSAMGSHFGMNVCHMEFDELKNILSEHVFLGTDIEGCYSLPTTYSPIVISMGSEGQGLSEEVRNACNSFYSIPGSQNRLAESLNVSVATAVMLDRLSKS
jgi:TrmH family RNA methyltransferase